MGTVGLHTVGVPGEFASWKLQYLAAGIQAAQARRLLGVGDTTGSWKRLHSALRGTSGGDGLGARTRCATLVLEIHCAFWGHVPRF